MWPEHLNVGAVRFARPTAHYEEILTFYRDELGLPVLAAWREHEGYDGVVFGLPGTPVHMEITQHGTPPVIPSTVVERLARRGHRPVTAANPYWPAHGAVLFADPDGWLVVLAPWVFGAEPPPQEPGRSR
jgi:catechol 2,3-dioxygenase-like lactoylglutathione lyase family enzyme